LGRLNDRARLDRGNLRSVCSSFPTTVGSAPTAKPSPAHGTQGGSTPFTFQKTTPAAAWPLPPDPSPHTVKLVTVEPGVQHRSARLGWHWPASHLPRRSGRHRARSSTSSRPKIYRQISLRTASPAAALARSSDPTPNDDNYSSDRLGDDVLAVIAALHLDKPGLPSQSWSVHSIAGEELSSIGSLIPTKVSGLIYLECSGTHSFYDRAQGDLHLDMIDVRNKIEQLLPDGGDPSRPDPTNRGPVGRPAPARKGAARSGEAATSRRATHPRSLTATRPAPHDRKRLRRHRQRRA